MSALRQAMTEAIQQVISEHDGASVVVRSVVCAEVVDANGERAMWTLTKPDQMRWDDLGLLTYALQMTQAQTTRDAVNDTD